MSPATQSSSGVHRLSSYSDLPQSRIPSPVVGRVEAEVAVRAPRRHASARRAVQKAVLNEERLVNIFDGVFFFADRGSNTANPDGASAELVDDGEQQFSIDLVESVFVDLEHLQRRVGNVERDFPVRTNLCVVTDAPQ